MSTQADVQLHHDVALSHPKKYHVYILNDDYTSMEFVVDVLMSIFHKTNDQAQNIMLEVHKTERGLCGIYTHEIAETKVTQVRTKSKDHGFPLKATMEEE